MAARVIDRAIQIHGGAGVSQDTFLAEAYTYARFMRIGDGPDQVHLSQLGRGLLKRYGASGLIAIADGQVMLCFRSSSRAIWLRWTSSGPSASRSRRAVA